MDPVLVLFSVEQHVGVALLLFFSVVGARCAISHDNHVVSMRYRTRSTSIEFTTERIRST